MTGPHHAPPAALPRHKVGWCVLLVRAITLQHSSACGWGRCAGRARAADGRAAPRPALQQRPPPPAAVAAAAAVATRRPRTRLGPRASCQRRLRPPHRSPASTNGGADGRAQRQCSTVHSARCPKCNPRRLLSTASPLPWPSPPPPHTPPASLPAHRRRPTSAATSTATAGGSPGATSGPRRAPQARPSPSPCPRPTSRAGCTWAMPCLPRCRQVRMVVCAACVRLAQQHCVGQRRPRSMAQTTLQHSAHARQCVMCCVGLRARAARGRCARGPCCACVTKRGAERCCCSAVVAALPCAHILD